MGSADPNVMAFVLPFGFKLGDTLAVGLDRAGKNEESSYGENDGVPVTDVYKITMATPERLAAGCRFAFECALRVDNSRLPPLVIDRDALNSGWRMDATTWTSLIERMRNLVGLDVSKVCLLFRCVVLLLKA